MRLPPLPIAAPSGTPLAVGGDICTGMPAVRLGMPWSAADSSVSFVRWVSGKPSMTVLVSGMKPPRLFSRAIRSQNERSSSRRKLLKERERCGGGCSSVHFHRESHRA